MALVIHGILGVFTVRLKRFVCWDHPHFYVFSARKALVRT
jgi:hypothetical protein